MTELLYLRDTYLFEEIATIEEVGENEFGKYIVLNRTIFYPQGGGQPSDTGIIKNDIGEFRVDMCRLSPEGLVYHYGEALGEMETGNQVNLYINKEERILNAKNHSAGHLLDIAITQLGYDTLEPGKGFHFPQGCYVEYSGEFDNNKKEEFIEKLEYKINKLIQQSIPMVIEYNGLDDLATPTGKTPRYAYFEGTEGCGCGGTHVKNSSEIGGVTIRKVKYKKGVLRISYAVKRCNIR